MRPALARTVFVQTYKLSKNITKDVCAVRRTVGDDNHLGSIQNFKSAKASSRSSREKIACNVTTQSHAARDRVVIYPFARTTVLPAAPLAPDASKSATQDSSDCPPLVLVVCRTSCFFCFSRKAASMAALLGPLPLDLASRLREMGYTPPPPRGSPTRSLEACLDGSTGGREVGGLDLHVCPAIQVAQTL